MDPALWEVMRRAGGDEVEAIIRLDGPPPPGVRIVSRFGDIATCRLPAAEIPAIRKHGSVRTLKAPRPVGPDEVPGDEADETTFASDERRLSGAGPTGRGVVLGVLDNGCDIRARDFRNADGSTRLVGIWDQRGVFEDSPRPWGYGRIYSREAINAALSTDDPFKALGYQVQGLERGTHGTHVMSIAAGNGGNGGPLGMAPGADLAFVELSKGSATSGLADLSDSVRIIEGADWVFHVAKGMPAVVNCSFGGQGGSHDGRSGVELALDAALTERPGRALVQSTGNYAAARAAAAHELRPGQVWQLEWLIFHGDRTENELEIWYPGVDVVELRIVAPDGSQAAAVPRDGRVEIRVGGASVGRAYHRLRDPNNGDHHIDCFLDPGAPSGRWRVEVHAVDVVDGRCRAWIERDISRPPHQSTFSAQQATPYGSLGTLANSYRPLVVGAYSAHDPGRGPAAFSSAGPTRDGRHKPDLVAPGVSVLAARSGGRDGLGLTRRSGTSMAAPHAAGAIACLFELARRPLSISETRSILLGTAEPLAGDDRLRTGSGRLNLPAAMHALQTARGSYSAAALDAEGGAI